MPMIREINLRFAPRLVIFDLDGTLVEFPHDFLFQQAFNVIQRFGYECVSEEVLSDSFKAFDFFRFIPEARREEFAERFWGNFDWANYPKAKAIDGAHAVLAELKSRGVETAIATARITPLEELSRELEDIGLLENISYIATRLSAEVPWTDKTQHIGEICRCLSVEPKDAVMVGDIPSDILTAREAGAGMTVAVMSGGIRRDVLEQAGPDLVISNVSDLIEAIYQ